MNLLDMIKVAVSQAQQRNRENQEVKTAPRSVFDKLRDKLEEARERQQTGTRRSTRNTNTGNAGGNSNIFDFIKDKVNEVKKDNEEDPNVETADSSVFNDLEEKIRQLQEENDRLRAEETTPSNRPKIDIQELEVPTSSVENNRPFEMPRMEVPQASSNNADERPGTIAMTNSNGGSLGLRTDPDFGAAQYDMRVPDMSRVTLVQYSSNSIMLDGQPTRWAMVDYQGVQGWIPESYLNFN